MSNNKINFVYRVINTLSDTNNNTLSFRLQKCIDYSWTNDKTETLLRFNDIKLCNDLNLICEHLNAIKKSGA